MQIAIELGLIAGAYLIGSISSATIVCRLSGLPDPRLQGSGNPGATNVLRIGGKRAALSTLLGDMLKGWLPVTIAQFAHVQPAVIGAVGVAAFLGHLYPVFFGFVGGKGVATSLGVHLGLSPTLGLAVIATWLAVAALFRYSSLAALVASLVAPLYVWATLRSAALVVVSLVICVLLFWRHRDNIRRLLAGREDRIGSGRAS